MTNKRQTITIPELRVETGNKSYVPKATQKPGDSGLDVERLQDYLAQFGYFQSPVRDTFGMEQNVVPAPLRGSFDANTAEALSRFQTFNALPSTGNLDEPTVDLMRQPRCGVPDLGDFVLQGSKWNKTSLTYRYRELTPDLQVGDVKSAIEEAFALWSAVCPLRFAEVASGAADIMIKFAADDHGCFASFDGAGGVLAHAFYPTGGEIAGDMHFDEDETWSVGATAGVDLVTVAAHELGHALGLGHSNVPGALMAPHYNGPHRRLEADDIAGVRALYGP